MIFLGDNGKWTSTLANLDTGAGPYLIKQSFLLMVCSSSIEQVKKIRLRTAASSLFKVAGLVTTELQVGQLFVSKLYFQKFFKNLLNVLGVKIYEKFSFLRLSWE